jgi:hypothetical protein
MMSPTIRRTACKAPFACILGSYFLLCGAVLPWFLRRVAPDAASYLTIARKYRAWEFGDAINGYWSPLLSWLVAPLLCLGAPMDVTGKCLEIAIGAGALAAVWWLGKRLELPEAVRVWTTLALVPAVAMYALTDTTPDLLVAALLVVYIGVVIGADYPRSLWQGAACGLLGALAYLAKAYAFPFFLAHFLAVSGYLVLRRRSSGVELRRLAAATAAGLLVFALVAGGWAGLLSRKYSRPTIGTTGAYQFSLRGQGHPTAVGGLYPPANKLAISAWEDPSDLSVPPRPPGAAPPARPQPEVVPAVVPEVEPFLPDGPLSRMVYRIYYNAIRYMGTLFRLSPLSPFILLGLFIACWNVPRGSDRDRWVILIGTMLLYPAGYLTIFINERFFWLITFLLSLSAGLLTTALPVLRRKPWSTCWAVVVAVSLSLWPAWLLFRLRHHALEEAPAVAMQLRPMMPPGTRIASDLEWGITNSIAFHLDARYYGLLRPDASAEEQKQQLRQHRIEYLLVWGDPAWCPFLKSAREVTINRVAGGPQVQWPRVFKLKVPRDPRSTGEKPAGQP